MAVPRLLAGAAPADIDGFVVTFLDRDGVERRVPLAEAVEVALEAAPPVRSFPSYRGQKSFAGLWWSATLAEHVGYESWLERDHAMLLDFDLEVVAFASQPLWLHWTGEGAGRPRRHAPDFFARLADGSGVVIDVRGDDRIDPDAAAAFAATERACARVGWCYRRVGELDPVLAANLRWLAGYRHPRCRRGALVGRLREAFTAPGELLAGAAAVGDPVMVLPVVFHLLWSQELLADLASAPLAPTTLIRAAGTGDGAGDGGR